VSAEAAQKAVAQGLDAESVARSAIDAALKKAQDLAGIARASQAELGRIADSTIRALESEADQVSKAGFV